MSHESRQSFDGKCASPNQQKIAAACPFGVRLGACRFGRACALSPCAMAQVSAAEQAEFDKFYREHGTVYGGTGEKFLHFVASKGGVAVVQFLIDGGADVNEKSTGLFIESLGVRLCSGETPLHHAAWFNKNPEVSKLLIENGSDVNAKGQSYDGGYFRTILSKS